MVQLPGLFQDFKKWIDKKINLELEKLTKQILIFNPSIEITQKKPKQNIQLNTIVEKDLKNSTEVEILQSNRSYRSELNVAKDKEKNEISINNKVYPHCFSEKTIEFCKVDANLMKQNETFAFSICSLIQNILSGLSTKQLSQFLKLWN